MTKFTLQALALTGILAVSGLPALAADMTPAAPAPNASVSSGSNAKVGTSGAAIGTAGKSAADTNLDKSKAAAEKKADSSKTLPEKKVDASKAATAKKAEVTKAATEKKTDKTVKDSKNAVHQQTAQRPAPSVSVNSSVGTGNSAGTSGSVGATVH